MLDTWLYIGIFFLVAPLIPAVAILIPKLVAPRKPNSIKLETYECGLETVGESRVQFKIQYYIFALVFLIFDIFPWNRFINPMKLATNLLAGFAYISSGLPTCTILPSPITARRSETARASF